MNILPIISFKYYQTIRERETTRQLYIENEKEREKKKENYEYITYNFLQILSNSNCPHVSQFVFVKNVFMQWIFPLKPKISFVNYFNISSQKYSTYG